MKKNLLCLFLLPSVLTVCAASSVSPGPSAFEVAKATFHDKPVEVTYSHVVSVQPSIISNAECAKIFTIRKIPEKFAPYQTNLINVDMKQVEFQPINDKLTAVLMFSEVTFTLPGKQAMVTPRIVTTVFNHKTLSDDGEFYTFYCRGKVHGQR